MEILGPSPEERVYDSEFGCRMYEVWKYDYELRDTDLAKYHCCFAKYLRVLEQPKNPEFPGPSKDMKAKLPYGKFLEPFSYEGYFVCVRLVDDSMFGGKAWKIYSRWLDNAENGWRWPMDDWAKMILPRINNSAVHHPDHMPYEYRGIPDASRMSTFLKESHKNSCYKNGGYNIPKPYQQHADQQQDMLNEWEHDLGIKINLETNSNPYNLTF